MSLHNLSRVIRGSAGRTSTLLSISFICLAGGVSAQQVSLALGSGSTNAGSSITLSLALANSGGSSPASVGWTMTYPSSDVVSVSATAGAAATQAAKSISCYSLSGNTRCAVYGLNANTILAGTLAQVTFHLASAPPDAKVSVQVANPISSLAGGEGVATTGTGGTVSIVSTTPALTGFSCSPTTFGSAGSSTCTVGLSVAAAAGGFGVSVGSSNANVSVPATVTVAQGSLSASFSASVKAVTSAQSAVLTAKAGTVSKTSTFSLTPASAAPVLLASVSCSPSSLSASASASCTATLTAPATANVLVKLSSNNSFLKVPSSVTITAGKTTASFTAVAGAPTTKQTGVITATGPNNSQTASETILAPVTGASIWSASAVPGAASNPDTHAVELGVKFRASTAGSISGIRFYKSSQNTGTHIGHLWTKTGQLLATVTFTSETASGWQKASFSSPVAIQANTTYVVSYHTSVGHYASDENYFSSKTVTNGPLQALQNGTDGGNGVYLYGSGGFPNQTWNASNYWVDVLFSSSSTQSSATALSLSKEAQ